MFVQETIRITRANLDGLSLIFHVVNVMRLDTSSFSSCIRLGLACALVVLHYN